MRKTTTLLGAAALLLLATGATTASAAPGDLDESFSKDGKVQLGFGGEYDDVTGRDVLVLSSGKVVVLTQLQKDGTSIFGVTRLKKSGAPDPGFHADGKRTTSFTGNDVPTRVVGRGQGRILVAGSADGAFALAAYQPDGRPDTSFGGDGKVTTDVTPGADRVLYLRVLPDSRILAAGVAGDEFAVVRYHADGTPDTTFGTGGILVTSDGFAGTPYAVTLQLDGKLVAVGMSLANEDSLNGLAVARYDTDGTYDETFGGGDGHVETFPPSREVSRGFAVLVQPDGRIVVGGTAFGEGDYSRFCIARYTPEGELDPTFADGGLNVYLFHLYYSRIFALARQGDGKVVAAGWTDREDGASAMAVARYRTDGELDTTFSGNGKKIVEVGSRDTTGYGVAARFGRIVVVGDALKKKGRGTVGLVARLKQ
jgi:uncharacterized delta-60 repeat protein